jgi:stage II sporulation protein GA (sporulation sigma-E factor processing peptidase)
LQGFSRIFSQKTGFSLHRPKEKKNDSRISTFFLSLARYNKRSDDQRRGEDLEQPIYGDVLFFVNFSMDFLTLYLTSHLLHLPSRAVRMALAAALGGIYGVAALFFPMPTILTLIAHLGVSLLLCAIAFPIVKWRQWLKSVALFYGVGFLLGGSMTAVYHLLNHYLYEDRIFYAGNYETLQKSVSARMVLLLAAISAILVFVVGRLFLKQSKVKTATLAFCVDGKETCVTALIDSGNLLCDSVSGAPVAFVQYGAAKVVLGSAWQHFFCAPTISGMAKLPLFMARRLCVLPAVGVGKEKMTLFCLRPDWVKVDGIPRTLLLAITAPLSRDFGSYQALLPPL